MNTTPINYELTFEPDLKKFTFHGTESILVYCKKLTNTITMNCAELKIKSCQVKFAGKIIKSTPQTNEKNEELQIKLGEKIKGNVTINIEFQGILNDRLLGFYRSKYKHGGKTKYLATTQFEAADARRAFPCWDEPEAKASFEISIIADNKFTAISNMPIKSKKKTGSKTIYKFRKTPVVSTYLIYLGVGEFEYLTGKIGKTQIRVVTTKGNKSKGKFSLELGKKLLTSYEKYFGIKFPLPKLDLIAIPDFAAGAMENWGAITFRETILLYDPKTSSTRTKQYIAEVISHEIAHMWFGNLVTMKWWNDLWLNESFATFMATKFVDKFYPEWDLWSQFIEDAMNVAMGLDTLKTTHPIDVKVNSPSEIREIFDAISYDKGGCVLRMLEHYVGEPNFRKGLKQYLSDFKYKNAEGKDLWNAIGKASRMPVTSMINTWLKQPGFPLVEINQDGNSLKLKQKRYLLEHDEKFSKGLWSIPLSLGLENEISKKLFSKKSLSIKLPKNTIGFVANYGRKGFYRVKYDEGILLDLKMLVDEKRIPEIDRWAIQNDLFSFCVSGDEQVRNYLDFSDAYYDEDSYLVSVNVAHNLASLYFRAFDEKFVEEIYDYAVNYFRKILFNLGWDPKKSDKHTDALLRAFVISVLGKMNDEEVTEEALRRYDKFLKSPSSLSPDLVEPICSIAAWNGNTKTHGELTKLYQNAKTMEEKLRFLGAMCGFKDKKLLIKSLDFSQTSEVRSQNMQLPIMKVAANPYGDKVLWPWLKKNWKKLNKKVGHGNPLFNRIVASISSVTNDSMEKEIIQFFKKNPTPGTERTQAQTLERIRINSKFLRSMRKEFKDG
ncbi:MAG: M1 family peptidase [Candidatus Nitrosopumilus sp. MTA1]|uniref:Aminopeptidase n=1 Tax=Marine Group I thaumarchaeote TaxID=2511932 RepID=A0A7K4MWT1_9ARCH|nr:MAG: M1 family peptidase [Nitrosopumilus sp. YT1]NMI82635.1 M1 family peptidase [Candidatus Nitrosopumilus sp. MTA1]NWJ28749.1 M1 family metallopeptidase [Marine Group I thaumarchaeote]NWJ57261.1 M1 family metallopeptidase [Marine Group I thaumarchaeote]NWK01299.1 M1 family metallopeptidase [Marine Group I thaumarchaeote]